MTLTDEQVAYLRTQRLGRLATLRPDGGLQNNPVGFWLDDQRRILIGGRALGSSQKFRNARTHPQVAFVVDDLASVDPWRPRMVEIRGTAEALTGQETPPGFSGELIRITPERVIAFL
jgi:pyridoxamine 5'-phosphate oxidase family protein